MFKVHDHDLVQLQLTAHQSKTVCQTECTSGVPYSVTAAALCGSGAGATYPVGKAAEEAFLRAGSDTATEGLTVDIGEGRAGRGLASHAASGHMSAWITGLVH